MAKSRNRDLPTTAMLKLANLQTAMSKPETAVFAKAKKGVSNFAHLTWYFQRDRKMYGGI